VSPASDVKGPAAKGIWADENAVVDEIVVAAGDGIDGVGSTHGR